MADFEKSQETNKDFNFYKNMIEEIIKGWNIDPATIYNEQYKTWSLIQGSANFEVGFFNYNKRDYFYTASNVVKLPDENLLAFYRRLLELNDYYIGVKLSVKGNQVWLLGQRECEGMDKGEAQRIIDNVRIIADDLDDRLINEFGAKK
jgi:hypothetical protein